MESSTADVSECYSILKPTRKGQRLVRQLLANLREGEHCPSLASLAAGDLSLVLRFLSATPGMCFFFVGSHQRRLYALGGPRKDSVLDLGLNLLNEVESTSVAVVRADPLHAIQSSVSRLRHPFISEAIAQICDAVKARDDVILVLGWRIDGEQECHIARSFGISGALARDHICWFLQHRLGATCLGATCLGSPELKLSKDGLTDRRISIFALLIVSQRIASRPFSRLPCNFSPFLLTLIETHLYGLVRSWTV